MHSPPMKTPHSMMLPPPCFTVFSSLCAVLISATQACVSKSLILVSFLLFSHVCCVPFLACGEMQTCLCIAVFQRHKGQEIVVLSTERRFRSLQLFQRYHQPLVCFFD
ncbi:hypothetical protein AMECASPLE_017236 [Ameca splendens]|uniref:Secreted protein n=1 Tax=Ameca splendens TaxID=208324 RepID=A0ABV0Y2V4_9TELE